MDVVEEEALYARLGCPECGTAFGDVDERIDHALVTGHDSDDLPGWVRERIWKGSTDDLSRLQGSEDEDLGA